MISDMVTATRRKGRLGFLQDYRRLNVALTRCVDVFFIIVDMNAILDQPSVAQAVKSGEVLDLGSQFEIYRQTLRNLSLTRSEMIDMPINMIDIMQKNKRF